MKENCAHKILSHFGWQLKTDIELPAKCVICVAPHTSNWDFVIGVLFKSALHIKASFFMKKEWFRFPFGKIMRKLGGIPVDRDRKTSMTDRIAQEYSQREQLAVALTPEGTRSYNPNWKHGFYHIAQKANVPIVLAFIDYKKKTAGYETVFIPTGNIDADIQKIKDYYRNVSAKYPEKFGL